MGRLAAALLPLLVAAAPASSAVYRPWAGRFSAELPEGWHVENEGALLEGSGGWMRLVGKVDYRPRPLGAIVVLSKRVGPSAKGGSGVYDCRLPDGALNVRNTRLAGREAIAHEREEEVNLHDYEQVESFPETQPRAQRLRAETVSAKIDGACYTVSYEALQDRFEQYRPGFERVLRTFRPLPDRPIRPGPPPARGLVLSLDVQPRVLRPGESPWYLLVASNTSAVPVALSAHDFWRVGAVVNGDMRLDLRKSDGAPVREAWIPHGFHGELDFWDIDCGPPWRCPYPNDALVLLPGESVRAAPSKVAPIRPQEEGTWGPLSDARVPRDAPEKDKAEARRLLEAVRGVGESIGQPAPPDASIHGPEAPRYPGYRILDQFVLAEPGKYRIRMVYDDRQQGLSLPGSPALEAEYRAKAKRFDRTRAILAASNVVEVEVVPGDEDGRSRIVR